MKYTRKTKEENEVFNIPKEQWDEFYEIIKEARSILSDASENIEQVRGIYFGRDSDGSMRLSQYNVEKINNNLLMVIDCAKQMQQTIPKATITIEEKEGVDSSPE